MYIIASDAITALAALLGAFIGALLTHKYNRKRDHLELKRDVLKRVAGYRWHLTLGNQKPDSPIFTALNEIFIVFAGDKNVEREIANFHKTLKRGFQAEDLRPVLEAMAISAKVPHESWSNDFLESAF
ncbi:MAG: hypothetical protein OXC97_08005, partial [Candidatus Dadabacteria bacterium]|nr:hypothetical protein [Candidatus Dadabacteria bacterium]